jgi:hypothetical protein
MGNYNMNDIAEQMDFMFIILDTLRFDVAERLFNEGHIPNLAQYFPEGWQKCHAPGSFTFAFTRAKGCLVGQDIQLSVSMVQEILPVAILSKKILAIFTMLILNKSFFQDYAPMIPAVVISAMCIWKICNWRKFLGKDY